VRQKRDPLPPLVATTVDDGRRLMTYMAFAALADYATGLWIESKRQGFRSALGTFQYLPYLRIPPPSAVATFRALSCAAIALRLVWPAA
jgi:hypothetical protein